MFDLGVLNKIRHSLRTRSSLAIGSLLLTILLAFYVGGRVVLVHLIKDAEQDVRAIETEVNRVAMLNTERIRKHVEGILPGSRTRPLQSFLSEQSGVSVSLAMRLSAEGIFTDGRMIGVGAPEKVAPEDIGVYADNFRVWVRLLRRRSSDASLPKLATAGIANVRGVPVYCAIAPCPDGSFLVLGMQFSASDFTEQASARFANQEIKVIAGAQLPMAPKTPASRRSKSENANPKGVAPFLSEALDFYSGGFWELDENPFEAVFTIRDLAGNPVSMITVSLTNAFSRAAETAIGRLTLFVSLLGIILVFPIFMVQSRMLLNPLARMTDCVKRALARRDEKEFSRLDWRGADEFAELAFAINSLLESMANRTLAIEEVKNRQNALINDLPDALLVFDRRHRLISVIKQPEGTPPIPGLKEESPIDVTVYGRDGVDKFGAAVDAAFATEKPQILNLETGKRPYRRYLNLRLSLMDKSFVLAIFRDNTETVVDRNRRRAAESRLQHVQKQESLTLFAGSIAHDVNNVLAAVMNMAEIGFMDSTSPFSAEALDSIRDAVRRGSAMTRELMAFAGETRYSFQRSDPSKLVQDAKRLLDGIIGEGVKVNYDLPANLPAVDADPDQLWKVFFNLVKNASESMHGVGEIKIATHRYEMNEDLAVFFFSSRPLPPGPGVLITITDNGPGIPKDMQRKIFDPYVSSKSVGRGFGLATVNSIVDAHHGGIRVESQLGKGTTFGVFLPVSKIAVVRALPPRDNAPSRVLSASQAIKVDEVLLIDDDRAILKTTSILLKALSFSVYTATDQASAVEIFRRHATTISCVIMDAHLETGESSRLIASFRATNPAIPIVVTSGSSQEAVQALFTGQPYDAFLGKPYTLADMKSLLDGLLVRPEKTSKSKDKA